MTCSPSRSPSQVSSTIGMLTPETLATGFESYSFTLTIDMRGLEFNRFVSSRFSASSGTAFFSSLNVNSKVVPSSQVEWKTI